MFNNFKDRSFDNLMEGISTLQNSQECYLFFQDICTMAELKAMAQRFEVAKMLSDRKVYSEIVRETGASTATISRVNRCINYGDGGYKLALSRLGENNE